MACLRQHGNAIIARIVGLLILLGAMVTAQAQTFSVLHEFTGSVDGGNPYSSLVMDRSGSLYGVTPYGGHETCETSNGIGCGVAFKLEPKSGGWLFYPLYAFNGHGDGANPAGNLAIAPNGVLFGTTDAGGIGSCRDSFGDGCGTVFLLRPPAALCRSLLCPWDETQLYRFTGGDDGNDPWAGAVLDQAGNVYGTNYAGGSSKWGVVFEVSPAGSGWTEATIHTFTSGNDGANPTTTPVFDGSGNLYGTTRVGGNCSAGGTGCGTVFQLTPSGSGWNENIVYNFSGSYGVPLGGLVLDPEGNIYGSASTPNTVFELSNLNGTWNATSLYSDLLVDLQSFRSTLARDAAGNLYGTSEFGGNTSATCVNGCGYVYKLTPSSDGWTFTELYEFTGGSDGALPIGGVVLDGTGNLYGTTYTGGTNICGSQGCGVVWKISQ